MSEGPRRPPVRAVVATGVVVELFISVPLAVDLQRLSTRSGTAAAYLAAARHGDCDRLVDLRTRGPRSAGIRLAGSTLKWCRAQSGPVHGLALVMRKASGHWRVVTVGPCDSLPQAWRDVEASCNLP